MKKQEANTLHLPKSNSKVSLTAMVIVLKTCVRCRKKPHLAAPMCLSLTSSYLQFKSQHFFNNYGVKKTRAPSQKANEYFNSHHWNQSVWILSVVNLTVKFNFVHWAYGYTEGKLCASWSIRSWNPAVKSSAEPYKNLYIIPKGSWETTC